MTPGSCTQLSTPPTLQQLCPKAFFNRLTPQALYGNAKMVLTLAAPRSHLPHRFATEIL